MTEYPLLVECDAAVAVEISADARSLHDRSMQSRHARNLGESPLHPSRKSIEPPSTIWNAIGRRIQGAAQRWPAPSGLRARCASNHRGTWGSLFAEVFCPALLRTTKGLKAEDIARLACEVENAKGKVMAEAVSVSFVQVEMQKRMRIT